MEYFRKTIKQFLIDGDPSKRISCELSNWSGIGYKIPRIKIKDSGDRTDLNKPGVYLLFGKDENNNNAIYIGEADPIFKRLKDHIAKWEFWNEVIVFVSKDQNLNKAHVKYLEHTLFEKAKYVNRYNIKNTNTPSRSSISESDEAEMEEFVENIYLLTSSLGHKVFDELVESKTITKSNSDIFIIKAASGSRRSDARGIPTSSGFVVLRGSTVAKNTVAGLGDTYEQIRKELIKKKIIIKSDDNYTFSKDYEFSSASTAARIVMGRSANGLNEWKLTSGMTLKQFESKETKDLSIS